MPMRIQVTVNLTPNEWELYSSMTGVMRAAEALNKAATKAINDALNNDPNDAHPERIERIYENMRREIEPVMERYRKFGAFDTEPRAVFRGLARRAVEAHFG